MRGHSLRITVMGATIAIIATVAPAMRVGAATTACTKTSGVTVIVDFTSFHGRIERGCAPGSPATALAAVRAAGFGTAGTTRYGDAFLCRIDNLPAPKVESCTDTPPARTSWSFYYARPDDSTWTFSSSGVSSYRPPAGTIIAFAFGNDAKPGLRPAAVQPKSTPTTTTAAPPPAPAPTSPPVVAAAATTTTAAEPALSGSGPSTTRARAVPLHSTTSAGATTSTRVKVSARRPHGVIDRSAIGDTQVSPSSGSALPTVLGAALVLGLAVAAGLTIRARRRRAT